MREERNDRRQKRSERREKRQERREKTEESKGKIGWGWGRALLYESSERKPG